MKDDPLDIRDVELAITLAEAKFVLKTKGQSLSWALWVHMKRLGLGVSLLQGYQQINQLG